jgi:hypothetical protein
MMRRAADVWVDERMTLAWPLRSRPWVYEHAAELGAFRFGPGPKARIGFDREAIERWKRDHQILKPAATSAATRRRGRPRKKAGSSAGNLIPYDPSPYRA